MIQCQPEESNAALRREALRAERILPMRPRGSLDTGYHTSNASQKNPMPRCGGRRFEPRGFFRCVQEEVWTQDTIHPMSARRIRCRVAAGGASSREDSFDASKRKFGHRIPYIQCQPEESDAALRREALRAERILPMCPNGSLDTLYHKLSLRQEGFYSFASYCLRAMGSITTKKHPIESIDRMFSSEMMSTN